MNLTESQQRAIAHSGRNLQLIACAGSGKTEVVARRVVHLLTPGRPDSLLPRNVIAFTFTDKAAAELKERIVTRTREALGEIPGEAELFDGDVRVDLSTDGRYLALARTDSESPSGTLSIFDLQTRAPRLDAIELDFPFGAVSMSPDNTLVALSGGREGRVEVRSAQDGSLVTRIPALARPADARYNVYTAAVVFLPDGRLAIGSQEGPIRIVDARTGAELGRFDGARETSEAIVAVTADGTTLVTSGARGTMAWDVATGTARWPRAATGCNDLEIAPRLLYGLAG